MFGLEEKVGAKTSAELPIFAWLVEHSADCINKTQVGVDGKSSYERLKGRKWAGPTFEFGCRVHHRAPGRTRGGSLQERWHKGIYLGTRMESHEQYVSMPDGTVVRAGSVEPFPVESMCWAQHRPAIEPRS